jgi:hypothetical protein
MHGRPCRYDAAAGRWICGPIVRNGITYIRSFAYFDANGNSMRRYDPELTASTNTRNGVHGEIERDNGRARIRSAGELTVSNLLGNEESRTLDGREAGIRETELRTTEGVASTRLEFLNRTLAVVIPVRQRSDAASSVRQWPLSGQAIRAHAITVTRGDQTNTERVRETTTFNGTALVPVEIVTSHGTRHCVRNLATGTLTCERVE